jgi:glutaredoxin-related protein
LFNHYFFCIIYYYFYRDDILQQMRTFSGGRNTVPQIFFNSDHIGGNDDLQKLELDGKLNDKVATVRKNAVSYMQDNWFHPWY